MSLKIIETADGRVAPVIVCDHCGEVIREAKRGVALWNEIPRVAGTIGEVMHAHCGACHDAIEKQSEEGFLPWINLDRHIWQLTENVSMYADDMDRQRESDQMIP